MAADKLKVVVTGAAGKTGGLIVKKLVERSAQFEPRALVRSDKSKAKVTALGVAESAIFTANIATASAADLAAALKGVDALVIGTSGVPEINYLSLIPVFVAKLTGQKGVSPSFTWKEGQKPEQVDWLGQKAQIDAAKAAGVKHVVIISSMGGTDPTNALNKLGDGGILMWKRKAEQYLIASGLQYTIIHPGGLIDKKGGERQILIDVDDVLITRTSRSIPREDVAEVAVQCLLLPQALNKSFDIISIVPGEGTITTDIGSLVDSLQGKTCDYSINSQMQDGQEQK
ncbi:MAG: hypothetical protein WDW36_000456 [Sanguina aurantia]